MFTLTPPIVTIKKLLLPISIIGCSIITTLVVLLFRWSLENDWIDQSMMQSFTISSDTFRALTILIGSALIGSFFTFVSPLHQKMGVGYVLQQFDQPSLVLDVKNMINQWISTCVLLLSGHSTGREGPAIHIGGFCGYWLGHRLKFDESKKRLLVLCAGACSITAIFNTPIAAIFFILEIFVKKDYIKSMIALSLATYTSHLLVVFVFEYPPPFTIPIHLTQDTFTAIYWSTLLPLGVLCGLVSLLFYQCALWSKSLASIPIWARFFLLGLVTACLAYFYPQIMGTGYAVLESSLHESLGLLLLVTLILAKLIATAFGAGLGLPIGIIGPLLVIGALTGHLYQSTVLLFEFSGVHEPGYYALIGMVTVLGCTLRAPLMAVITIFELAGLSYVVPSMLCLIPGLIMTQLIFKQPCFYRLSTTPSL